jgi:Ni,Fe-hydrogenase III large subunit
MAYAALKERVQRLNERLTGHRFLFGAVSVGTGTRELGAGAVTEARAELRAVAGEHANTWRQLQFAISLQERLAGVGIVTGEEAKRLGGVGPVARAAGLRHDVRAESPRLWYGHFKAVRPAEPAGDVASRMAQRALELEQSLAVLDELLARPLPPGQTREVAEPAAIGIARVESPRGSTLCLVERDGDALSAFHLRTGSYANWPVLAHAVPGNLLPDFPLINKSFELCYACVDR